MYICISSAFPLHFICTCPVSPARTPLSLPSPTKRGARDTGAHRKSSNLAVIEPTTPINRTGGTLDPWLCVPVFPQVCRYTPHIIFCNLIALIIKILWNKYKIPLISAHAYRFLVDGMCFQKAGSTCAASSMNGTARTVSDVERSSHWCLFGVHSENCLEVKRCLYMLLWVLKVTVVLRSG